MGIRAFKSAVNDMSVDEALRLIGETRDIVMQLWKLRPPMPRKLRGPLATQIKRLSQQVHVLDSHLMERSSVYRQAYWDKIEKAGRERRMKFEMERADYVGVMDHSGLILT